MQEQKIIPNPRKASKERSKSKVAKKNANQRVRTAVYFVLAMLFGVFGGPYTYSLLFATILGLCLWEYLSMLLPAESIQDHIRFYVAMILSLTPFIVSALILMKWLPSFPFNLLFIGIFTGVFFLLFALELFGSSPSPFQNIGYIFLGLLYLGIPFTLLNYIAFQTGHYRPDFVISLLLLIWFNDTAAYILGSRYGKRPFFPRLSPKKTWMGFFGGLFFAILLSVILYYTVEQLSLWQWLVLAIVVSVFGNVGDLFESMLKRSVNVKDSGTLLPGHGGFLDRFDAFIFALPFIFLYFLTIG